MRRPRLCTSVARVTATLLLSFIGASSAAEVPILLPPSTPHLHDTPIQDFSLKQIFHHGTYRYPGLHRRLDVPENAPIWTVDSSDPGSRQAVPALRVRSEPMSIQRLVDRSREAIDGLLNWKRMTGRTLQLAASDWTVDEIRGPNVSDKESILTFARMAADAYVLEPNTGNWVDVGGGFNYTEDFGWEADGLRGHIFADTKNSTVVIGLKGTSVAVFDGSEPETNDKINDNLFFSCCCGQGGQYLWRQVCDCQTSAYTCNSTCLTTALKDKNRYYWAALDLYRNVTELYPDADIWVAGHSLGGAVSSFLGLTYGLPVITFEAVPDALPASRLGLPTPPGHQVGALQKRKMTGGYHFGHTADPVYMGECNKASSSCTFGGYALQSICHTGFRCVYDTVGDLGWRVGIGTHKIINVINDVLEKYDEPASCRQYENCTDCYPWEFFESNGTESTTSSAPSSTSTTSRTRTETCKTPGWWGCLDESTTTETTSTSISTTTTTSCKTPGWFGCKDPTTTTTSTTRPSQTAAPAPTITKTSSSPTSTTTCAHPGWFGGCKDPASKTLPQQQTHTFPVSSLPSSPPKSSCSSKGWLGLVCYDVGVGTASPPVVTERLEM